MKLPNNAIPPLCSCVREARKNAGYANYGQAGVATHRSPEAIGRHERGEVPMRMEDAIDYAESYGHPEILMAFCDQCCIRERLFGRCEYQVGNLPLTALRLSNRLREATAYAQRLAGILDDGQIDRRDLPALNATLDYFTEVEKVWRELVTGCMSEGYVHMKKTAPAVSEAVQHQNHSSQQP